MHALGIVTGPAVEPDSVLEPLLDRLDERGSVGVLRNGDSAPDRTIYEVGERGWTARGSGLDAEEALSKLAETEAFALVVGFPDAYDFSDPGRADHYATEMDVEYEQIEVRNQRTKWGSCSTSGTLGLNWRLMMARIEVVD